MDVVPLSLFLQYYWLTITLIIVCIGLAAFTIIHEFGILPSPARRLRKAKWKNRGIDFTFDDTGYVEVRTTDKIHPEGFTKNDKKETLGFFARRRSNVAELADKPVSSSLFDFLNKWATTKTFLKGCGVPATISYKGKAVLASLYAMVAVAMMRMLGQEIIKKYEDQKVTAFDDKTIKEVLAEVKKTIAASIPTPESIPDFEVKVDGQEIKTLFPFSWNQAQLRADEKLSEDIGYRKGKKEVKHGKEQMLLIIGGIIAIVAISCAVLIIVAYLFK